MKLARFTIIELLIVISIIMILAGLLLPSLTKARDAARSSLCRGNLRQLGFAMNNYASDYNEWGAYNPNTNYNALFGPVTSEQYASTLCPYLGMQPVSDPNIGPPAKSAICPSGRRDGTGDRTSTGNPNFSYSFSVFLCSGTATTHGRGTKISSVKKPSFRLFAADTASCNAASLSNNSYFAARHINKSDNILFVDNHTENWKYLQKEEAGSGSYSGGYNGFWHDATW